MNVAELERFVSRVDNDELDYHDGCDPYWAAELARRVIAAEKLVDALNGVLEQDDDHWAGTKAALTAYEDTK